MFLVAVTTQLQIWLLNPIDRVTKIILPRSGACPALLRPVCQVSFSVKYLEFLLSTALVGKVDSASLPCKHSKSFKAETHSEVGDKPKVACDYPGDIAAQLLVWGLGG